MKQARRVVWFILSTVLLCALLGGAYGRQVEATTGSDDSDVKASLNAFTRVYEIVEANYADPVDPDTDHLWSAQRQHGRYPRRAANPGPPLKFLRPARLCPASRRPGGQVLRRRHVDPMRAPARWASS